MDDAELAGQPIRHRACRCPGDGDRTRSDVATHRVAGREDDRKSAAVAQTAGRTVGGDVVRDFAGARTLLRDPAARQAGFLAEMIGRLSVVRPPIIYLHGAADRRQRGATARFFAPKVVTSTYRDLMEQTAAELVAGFRATGRADLDDIALSMAVTIAAEIVGLTDSDRAGMARRLDRLVSGMTARTTPLGTMIDFLRGQGHALLFLWRDVKPATRARRAAPHLRSALRIRGADGDIEDASSLEHEFKEVSPPWPTLVWYHTNGDFHDEFDASA